MGFQVLSPAVSWMSVTDPGEGWAGVTDCGVLGMVELAQREYIAWGEERVEGREAQARRQLDSRNPNAFFR